MPLSACFLLRLTLGFALALALALALAAWVGDFFLVVAAEEAACLLPPTTPTPFWVWRLGLLCLELRVLAALFIVLNRRVDATFGAAV